MKLPLYALATFPHKTPFAQLLLRATNVERSHSIKFDLKTTTNCALLSVDFVPIFDSRFIRLCDDSLKTKSLRDANPVCAQMQPPRRDCIFEPQPCYNNDHRQTKLQDSPRRVFVVIIFHNLRLQNVPLIYRANSISFQYYVLPTLHTFNKRSFIDRKQQDG